MSRLGTLWKKDPGLVVSGGAHLSLLAFLVLNLTHPPKVDPEIETINVEMVTDSDLNQITNGEKSAKPMPTPVRRADQVAAIEDHKELAPTPDAKLDTPSEASPDKAQTDPGHAEKPVEAAAPPPPAAPAPPPPPVPTPPERPEQKVEAAPPPPLPPERPTETAKADAKPEASKEEVKPAPDDAEPVMPPPRPKAEPPKHAKAEPKKVEPQPPPRPRMPERKIAKVEPPPPPPPPRPERKPERPLFDRVASVLDKLKPEKPLDRVASLLEKLKPDPVKPVERPRAGNEVKEAKPHDDFNPNKIAALLSHEAPQRKASTGRTLSQLASLGSPTAHAEKLSPTMAAQLDGWLIDHYRGCWNYFGLGSTADYVPQLRIHMAQDGSLIGQPALLNPPNDPNLRSLADSAIRAVNRCNPLEIPDRFRPYYDQGYKLRVVRFDPKEMS